MTPEQSKEIQKNLEELRKYFKISDKIQIAKNDSYYELHLIKVNDILDIYIRATMYQSANKILYELRITKGIDNSKGHSLISINFHSIFDFSIENIENGIIEAADRLVKNKGDDYKNIFGTMRRLGVKKWIKLNSLKQAL